MRPLRARLPHGGRVELLRQHGPRLRHHRLAPPTTCRCSWSAASRCGKCAETCPTGSIETNPRLLGSYDLDESRCIFCGECVEVCPYDALEQTDFFELAGYSRTTMARESLYVREPRPVDPLRETVTDLVPHVLDAELGLGWVWEPIKDDPDRRSTNRRSSA